MIRSRVFIGWFLVGLVGLLPGCEDGDTGTPTPGVQTVEPAEPTANTQSGDTPLPTEEVTQADDSPGEEATNSPSPASNDQYEPNNTYSQATALTLDADVQELVLLNGDVDFFTFTLTETRLVEFRVEIENPYNVYLEIAVTDERGEYVAEQYGSNVDMTFSVVLGAGQFNIQCSSPWDAVVYYSLGVAADEVADDELEDNDSMEQAVPMDLPSTTSALIINSNDPDYYRVTLPQDGLLSASLTLSSVDNDTYGSVSLHLLDAMGEAIHWREIYPNSTDEVSALLPSGDYYIRVYANQSDTAEWSYDLRLDLDVSVQEDIYEENDTGDDAALVELDLVDSALVFARGDEDWFRFEVKESGVVEIDVEVDGPESWGDCSIRLSDHNLETLDTSSVNSYWGGGEAILAELSEGYYYVSITCSLDTAYVDGNLNILSYHDLPQDSLEPNDGFSQATSVSLPYNSPELWLPFGDKDYFRFTLPQAQTLLVDVDAYKFNSELNCGFVLLDDHGEQLDSYDIGDFGDPYMQSDLAPGTYYLVVSQKSPYVVSDFYYLSMSTR